MSLRVTNKLSNVPAFAPPFPRPPTRQSPSRTVQRLGGTELVSRLRRSAMTAWGFHSHAYTWEGGGGGEGGAWNRGYRYEG